MQIKKVKRPRSMIVVKIFLAQEAAICEDLFEKGDYKVLVGDEDSSVEARLRLSVIPDLEKWSDKNHVLRTVGFSE